MAKLRDDLQESLGASYTLEQELGGGGMSHVFLARDATFDRAVVVKVLPPDSAGALSGDRFKREIALAAKLQHPHIVPVIGAGETSGGLPYYTMPFVEGESLRARIAREGELPVGEAVSILREVARALAYAHERGIVHRDIKPDNVMLSGGAAMVTDFGVAKALSASATRGGGTALTSLGVAIGTPAYMAPEQAAAEPTVDHRADIYAFGCMAYEMLAGTSPFGGRAAPAMLAAHITEAPESILRRRPNIPAALASLVMQCLEKRPADRPHDAKELLRALEAVVVTPSGTASVAMPAYASSSRDSPEKGGARWMPWATAAVFAVVLIAAVARWPRNGEETPLPELRFTVAAPAGYVFARFAGGENPVSLSPDGRRIAIGVARNDSQHVFVRDFADTSWHLLEAGEGAAGPNFSADGQQLTFGRQRKLYRMPADGGTATEVADAGWFGAQLGTDGTVYYSPEYNTPLFRLARGGKPEAITSLDTSRRELGHWRPQLLAGGNHLLFTSYATPLSRSRIELLDLRSKKRTVLVEGGVLGQIVGDVLVYIRGSSLMAARFDERRLRVTGEASEMVRNVATALSNGAAVYDVSRTGTLVYLPRAVYAPERELVWVDRSGRASPVILQHLGFGWPRISPDGSRLAVGIYQDGVLRLQSIELSSGIMTPISSEGVTMSALAWMPDSRELLYAAETPVYDVFRRSSDGASPERLWSASASDKLVTSVSADGRFALVTHQPQGGTRIATLDLTGTPRVTDVILEKSSSAAQLSPDGHWVAYQSQETGNVEIYLRSFPDVAHYRRQLSAGGREPRWSRNGREIVFRRGETMMAASFDPATGAIGQPVALFSGTYVRSDIEDQAFDVTPDGSRFIMTRLAGDAPAQHVVVIANWLQRVRKQLATQR